MSKPGQNAPAPKQIKALIDADWEGPIAMLNLLKFADKANYPDGDYPDCTGHEAYITYSGLAGPFVAGVGAKLVYRGDAKHIVIGDDAEDWDEVIIVQYPSKDAFLKMTSDPDYLKTTVHRTAALHRSALIATKPAG